MEQKRTISLKVNGVSVRVTVDPERPLLSVLRYELGMTGTKYGCGEGQCGACTVLVDGDPVRSCLQPVASVEGRSLLTIEGLTEEERLHPLQEAFLEEHAFQCGYCTPGQILSAKALLDHDSDPSALQVREAMQGNLCRCGTYPRILRAVLRAAAHIRGAQ